MWTVVCKRIWKDGITYNLRCDFTGDTYSIHESTLRTLLASNLVKGACLVHKKNDSGTFIRVGSDVESYDFSKSSWMPRELKDRLVLYETSRMRNMTLSRDVAKARESEAFASKIWNAIQKQLHPSLWRDGATIIRMNTKDKDNDWALQFCWEDGFCSDEGEDRMGFCGRAVYRPKTVKVTDDFQGWINPYERFPKPYHIDIDCLEIRSFDDIKRLLNVWDKIRKEQKI